MEMLPHILIEVVVFDVVVHFLCYGLHVLITQLCNLLVRESSLPEISAGNADDRKVFVPISHDVVLLVSGLGGMARAGHWEAALLTRTPVPMIHSGASNGKRQFRQLPRCEGLLWDTCRSSRHLPHTQQPHTSLSRCGRTRSPAAKNQGSTPLSPKPILSASPFLPPSPYRHSRHRQANATLPRRGRTPHDTASVHPSSGPPVVSFSTIAHATRK